MSYFDDITKRVELDPDNWIEVKQLSFGEHKRCMSNSMKMHQGSGDGDTIAIDPGAVQVEQMVLSVCAWGGPNFDGRNPTRDNVLALPMWITDKLEAAIAEVNEPLSDDEKKPLDAK